MYSDNPLTWRTFRQALLNEFLTPVEQQNRAMRFEKLKQTYGTSVEEYAQEFIKLAKYASYSVPIETARMERFKAGLITPLYKAIVSTEFSSLVSLIDRAKQLEAREIEERIEREQRKKAMRKF